MDEKAVDKLNNFMVNFVENEPSLEEIEKLRKEYKQFMIDNYPEKVN
jgi:hypothetical protein